MSKQEVTTELFYGGEWHAFTARESDPITIDRVTGAGKTDPSPCTLQLTIDDREGIWNPEDAMSPLYGLAGRNTPIRVTFPAGGRFHGEVSSYAPGQTEEFVAGTGRGDAWVGIEAAGVLRRLDQGADALPSVLRSYMDAKPGILAYFPAEDGSGSTAPSNAAPNGFPSKATAVSFGTDDELLASAGVMTFNDATSSFSAPIPEAAPSGFITGVLLFKLDAVPLSAFELFRIEQTGSVAKMTVTMDATQFGTNAYRADGTALVEDGISQGVDETEWIAVHYGLYQASPGTIGYAMYWHQATGSSTAILSNTGTFSGTLGRASRIVIAANANLANAKFAHIVVTNAAFPFNTNGGLQKAVDAWAGWENALERLERLCADAGIPFTSQGDIPVQAATGARGTLGAQLPDTLVSLLAQCERRDDGMLFEPRDSLGLYYRTRNDLYNQAPALTLDWSAQEVLPPLAPLLDDLASRNDVTVSRDGGGSARAVLEEGPLSVLPPPDGIGRYATKIDVSTFSDTPLPGLASWFMRKGTVGGIRYTKVTVDVDKVPAAALVDIGDRLDIANMPANMSRDGAALIVLGYTEVIETHARRITFACAPFEPYRVGTWNGETLYTFDVDEEGWAGEVGVTAFRTSLEHHDGAGSLRANKTMGAGFDSVRFNDGQGLRDLSALGSTLTMWAKRGNVAGTGWAAQIELQDAGFTWHAGPSFALSLDTWTQLSYTPDPALLASCRSIGVQFEATGVSTVSSAYIDTVGMLGAEPDRWDSAYTTLASDFDAGTDTTMTIAIEAGRLLWTTEAAHFPIDLGVSGARVRATAISGGSSPQTVTVETTVVNGVTKTIPAGTPVRLWKPARYAL